MGTIQVKFDNAKQFEQLIAFLQKLKFEFNIAPSDDPFSADIIAGADVHDAYKASLKVLSVDWDSPEDDHWDNYN
jgi:hypothetical protein